MTSHSIPQGRSDREDPPGTPTLIGEVSESHRAALASDGWVVYSWPEFWARGNRPPTPFDDLTRGSEPELVVWDLNPERGAAA